MLSTIIFIRQIDRVKELRKILKTK